ncbi:MAG: hypothetical protein ACI8QS_003429 [Planctomycetota bacterium]|jgi:hypothetical protein
MFNSTNRHGRAFRRIVSSNAGLGILGVLLLCMSSSPWAQDSQSPVTLETLEQRIAEMRSEFGLEREILEMDMEDLRSQLAEVGVAGQEVQRANVFNPSITVFGNMLTRFDDRRVYLDDDPTEARLDDRPHFREVEIDFRAAIDPFADAVVITNLESEAPGEFGAGLEEGYVEIKRLPFLESAPWGLKLRVGRMRPEFGRLNQVHLHDLPQPSYPRSLRTFLGAEGYVQEGLSGRFFLPIPGEEHALEANVQLMTGGGLPLAEDQSGSNLASVARIKYFRELDTASTVEVGSSIWHSDGDHDLYGFDATYHWKPLSGGERHSLLVGGEVFQARLDDPATDSSPGGYYIWSQYQLMRDLYLGTRFDRSEALEDDGENTTELGFFLTYYTSEFLRFRLGYEHVNSDNPILDDRDSLLLELNFIFGSHPTEPYWVSR